MDDFIKISLMMGFYLIREAHVPYKNTHYLKFLFSIIFK